LAMPHSIVFRRVHTSDLRRGLSHPERPFI
jgi:hypothetical protein